MITHILKDGTKVDSIAGRVIRVKDFEHVYQIIGRIEQRGREEKGVNNGEVVHR